MSSIEQQELNYSRYTKNHWNDNGGGNADITVTQFECLHTAFERQVVLSPDKVAVVFDDKHLTYKELDKSACNLALVLCEVLREKDVFVGVYLDRSIEMLIAMLAILKSGKAFLCLDTSQPDARIKQLISDAKLSVLLTKRLSLSENRFERRLKIININDMTETELLPKVNPQAKLNSPAKPNSLAYMVYTSGSTGLPKGVLIRHDGAYNHIVATLKYMGVEGEVNFLQSAPVSSDIAIWQFFAPILSGGKTVILKDQLDIKNFISTVVSHKVHIIEVVPSVLQLLLDYAQEHKNTPFYDLKIIMVTGEAVNVGLLNRAITAFPGILLVNAYGPAEASDDVTLALFTKTLPPNVLSVPVGKPIGGLSVYVLDKQLQKCPPGIAGEICIGGIGVADGYWMQQSKTLESFIANPFPEPYGSKLYRTGDIGKWDSDGNLIFLGRVDNQVKIRGRRIELGEIESHISRLAQIKEVVVTVYNSDDSQQAQLVAHVTLREGYCTKQDQERLEAKIKRYARDKLPDYMVPGAVNVLNKMPLLESGKIDRQQLASLKRSYDKSTRVKAARNEFEAEIVKIWKDVLKLETVGIDQDFFELGGSSIISVKVLYRINRCFGTDMDLRAFFRSPTIEQLAQIIVNEKPHRQDDSVATELDYEITLDPEITPCDKTTLVSAASAQYVLLTGVTGFLGSHMLQSILKHTGATVLCLVRGRDQSTAEQKFKEAIQRHLISVSDHKNRVQLVRGDLGLPFLGLDENEFNALSDKVDVIYHSGALVNFFYTYSQLKPINVTGTEWLLRLACARKLKPVHYVSTISVISDQSQYEIEDLKVLPSPQLKESAYTHSKWMSEQLIVQAAERGVPITIHRPGQITWNSQTGAFNNADTFYHFIDTCLNMRKIPSIQHSENWIPVDALSDLLICETLNESGYGNAFHYLNPVRLSMKELFKCFEEGAYHLEYVSLESWQRALRLWVNENPGKEFLFELLGGLKDDTAPQAFDSLSLSRLNLKYPEINQEYFRAFSGLYSKRKDTI